MVHKDIKQNKIPNSKTARGYSIVVFPSGRTVSEHNKLSVAKTAAQSFAMKNKKKLYIIRADIFETFYKKKK